MPLAYRLVKQKLVDKAFSGEGAAEFGGRWNGRGLRCVYLAASESLAILEVMAHLDDYAVLRHYALFAVDIPEQCIDVLPPATLPGNWADAVAPVDTAKIGNAWLDRQSPALALEVPSVIVPREKNYILNPRHDQFAAVVQHAQCLPFDIDIRLL